MARYLKLVNPEKYGINAPPNFPTAHEEHSLKITEKEHQVLASANVVNSFTDQNNTEYVTFQYQPDELYNCEEQSYDLGESTLTYEIPVVHQEFGDNSTNTTTFVELQVVQEKEAIKTGMILLIYPVVRSCNICEIKKGLWGTGRIACECSWSAIWFPYQECLVASEIH